MSPGSPARIRAGGRGGRLTTFAKHLALVLFGFLAAMLLLELGLRVAGAILRSAGQRGAAQVEAGDRVVLCVGDSHTYGAPLPREQSYPYQLQDRLARLDPDARWKVINRGIPGMNSAQLAALLEGLIWSDRPGFVVVWIGANNWWNREDPAGLHDSGRRSAWRALLEGSRLYRLYLTFTAQAAFRDWDVAAGEVAERSNRWLYGTPVPAKERFVNTVRDLSSIASILAKHRLPWVLVTYPQPEYKWQRSAAEQVERGAHDAIVHTADDLARARRDHPEAELLCPWPVPEGHTCLMVSAMGPHPTRLLYEYIAASIADALLALPGAESESEPEPESESESEPGQGAAR